jgi:DNA excision repair protein ERCC-4
MYNIVQMKPSKKNANPLPCLQLILEVNPKWRLLHEVLLEIRRKDKDKNKARILVMVKDERTLQNIKSYLVDGKDLAMMKRWLQYLKSVNQRSRALAKVSGGSSHLPEESRLLLEEEGRVRNLLFGSARNDVINREETKKVVSEWKKKKRRINEEKSRGNPQLEEDKERRAIIDEAIKETEYHEDIFLKSKSLHTDTISENDTNDFDVGEENCGHKVTVLDGLCVIIQTYTSAEGEQAYQLLNDVQPTHVVLYDAEPPFIRSLEIHTACIEPHSQKLSVYFMLFESSAEEKTYLKALEREQVAFEKLIQHKKNMAIPVNMIGPWTTQEMQNAGHSAVSSYNSGSLPLSMDTRTNRGKNVSAEKRDIAVDVREFRSALPSILHQGGMRLAPATLTVGDYVLSNVHCVERKSLSDLFGSFNNGRLYSQVEAMKKYYKVPCLLIEFDPSKAFCLQNANDIGPDIRNDSICSKMALLVIHFPELRFLWSRSPYESLKIFKTLKANHEEVDVDKAIATGSNESIDALLDTSNEGECDLEINEAARDMLLRLPGINLHNARKVMKECNNITELANMSRDDLKLLLGPLSGQKLFTFFNQMLD